jgi:hypothetical protein
MVESNRVIANAPDHPRAIPQIAGNSPYRSIKPVTRAGDAPIAMRMPISAVRCATEWAITAYMPATDRMRATTANADNNMVENRRGASSSLIYVRKMVM